MNTSRRRMALIVSIALALQLGLVSAQAQNRAGLVIQYADGRVATYCVRFGEPSITGLDLLNRAGLKVVAEVGGLGAATCSIDGQGCAYPAQPCFCQCQGASCAYWNYFHLIDGAWRYSPIGALGYTVTDGAVDGWAWGDKVTPPTYTIEQICSESPAAPTLQSTVELTNEPTGEPTSQRVTESAPTIAPAIGPTVEPTLVPAGEPALQPASRPTHEPTIESANPRTGEPVNPPTIQPARPSASQPDAGSYAVFAVVVIALGGWLIAARARRR